MSAKCFQRDSLAVLIDELKRVTKPRELQKLLQQNLGEL
jgi:hypothetical protein